MRKSSLLFFFTLLLSYSLYAQQSKIDSLNRVLKTAKEDSNKVKTLYFLSEALEDIDPSKAINYGNQGLSLAKSIDYKKGISICLNTLGNANFAKGDNNKALEYYKERYIVAEEINDQDAIASSLDNMSTIQIHFGNPDSALLLRNKAQIIYTSLNQESDVANGYVWIGNIYNSTGNYPTALKNYLEALRIFEKKKDTLNSAYALINISSVYRTMKQYDFAKTNAISAKKIFAKSGNFKGVGVCLYRLSLIFNEQQKIDSSTFYLLEAKKMFVKIDDKYFLNLTYTQLGDNYRQRGEYNNALLYLNNALIAAEEMQAKASIAYAFEDIGAVYYEQKKYAKALEYSYKADFLYKEVNAKDNQRNLAKQFIEIYSQINKPDSVLNYFTLYQQLSDTIHNEQNSKAISEMQIKYETEKKEKENTKLKLENQVKENDIIKQRNLKLISVGTTLVLILIISLLVRNRRIKSRAYNLAQQSELLKQRNDIRQRISNDLHDEIGSGLTAISMICVQGISDYKNQVPIKLTLLDKISLHSRNLSEKLSELIWATNPEHDDLSNLISNIRSYTYKFFENSTIQFDLNISDTIPSFTTNSETNRNIFLILKEGLNNIVKHSTAQKVKIDFIVDISKDFKFSIMDNGQGFDINTPTKGNGRSSIGNRVAAIKNGKFELNSKIGVGTALIIEGNLS